MQQAACASISAAASKVLWDHFDAQYGCTDAHTGTVTAAAELPREPAPHPLISQQQLSRSQINRQWNKWRTARQDVSKAHTHAASIHAHRRRGFGPDDTLFNRIQSIAHDAAFVKRAAARFPSLPLVANLRCGAWYSPAFAATVRFKSTDGHRGEWNLNPRRLNLHLVELVVAHGGALLVDATRRGRLLPDSFAKTVPIWCACINLAIAAERALDDTTSCVTHPAAAASWCRQLHTSACVVDEERCAIEERLEGFVHVLQTPATQALLGTLKKPLRPLWLTATAEGGTLSGADEQVLRALERNDLDALPFTPVVCLSASEPIDRQRRAAYTYLQGSADDEEDWAVIDGHRLTAASFWKHHEQLLEASEASCTQLAADIVANTEPSAEHDEQAFAWLSKELAIGSRQAYQSPECWKHFQAIINVGDDSVEAPAQDHEHYLYMPVAAGKKDVRSLERQLPAALRFAAQQLAAGRRLLVLSELGTDRAVAVVVALLVSFFNNGSPSGAQREGERCSTQTLQAFAVSGDDAAVRARVCMDAGLCKAAVTQCVHSVSLVWTAAAPPRHTLKKLHRFFTECNTAEVVSLTTGASGEGLENEVGKGSCCQEDAAADSKRRRR